MMRTTKPLAGIEIARLKFQLAERDGRIQALEEMRDRDRIIPGDPKATAIKFLERSITELGWNGMWSPPADDAARLKALDLMTKALNVLKT